MLRNENGMLSGYVYVDVAGRDIGHFLADARARVGKRAPSAERPYRERESYKWEQSLRALSQRLPPGLAVVVITDRESDVFEYFLASRRPGVNLCAWA